MTEADFKVSGEIRDRLEEAGRVLVMAHHNPDGDALGSASALVRTLAGRGKKPRLHLAGEWAGQLDFLLEGLETDPRPEASDYDLVCILDCHGYDRLGPAGPELAEKLKNLPLLVIDHHLLSDREKPGSLWLHYPAASSTGELVWRLIKALAWRPPREAVQGLLLAIASDTGFFGQANTTADSLRATADLLDFGGDLADIKRRLLQDQPFRRLKLMGLALDSLKLHFQGRLASMAVTPAMLVEAEAGMVDTENFVEIGRGLAGVALAALIKDSGEGPGSIRVSLRSREGVDARSLALSFGGGGHREAAAYNDHSAANAEEALNNLLARAESYL